MRSFGSKLSAAKSTKGAPKSGIVRLERHIFGSPFPRFCARMVRASPNLDPGDAWRLVSLRSYIKRYLVPARRNAQLHLFPLARCRSCSHRVTLLTRRCNQESNELPVLPFLQVPFYKRSVTPVLETRSTVFSRTSTLPILDVGSLSALCHRRESMATNCVRIYELGRRCSST